FFLSCCSVPPPPRSPPFPYTTLFRSRSSVRRSPVPAARRTARDAHRAAPSPRAARSPLPPPCPDVPSAPRRRLPPRRRRPAAARSEEHTSELQSRENLVCRLLLEKKK